MIDGYTLYEIVEEATTLIWDEEAQQLQDMTAGLTRQIENAVRKGATALKEAQAKGAAELQQVKHELGQKLHAEIVKRQEAERKAANPAQQFAGRLRRWSYSALAPYTQRDRWREAEKPLAWWRAIAGATYGRGGGREVRGEGGSRDAHAREQ